MALLRLIHAADLPDPAAVLTRLSGEAGTPRPAPSAKPQSSAPTASVAPDFQAFVDQLEAAGLHRLGLQLRDHVGVVRYAPGELVLRPLKPLGPDFARELAAAAKQTTAIRWTITFSDDGGEPSLRDKEAMAEERVRAEVLAEPNVRAVLEAFPDASLESFAQSESFEPTKGA